MTNTIAAFLAAVILALLAMDWLVYDWWNLIYVLKKGADLIEWLAFWR